MAIESVVGSLVSKIAELLAEPVKKQFRYMFCFDNFVQEFNEQVMSLALALYRLQDAVDVAKRNAEEIEIDVNKWLEDAKNEIDGVNRLEKEKGKNGICFTWCPKWIRLFKLSKALEKKTETLRKLEENSRDFRTKVSHKAPLQDIEFLPSKEFTPSESSKEAFEQIMKALKDDNVNMIGLYGMGGVGKTTLVREVGRRAKETQLFDAVLLATVSQNPNVMYIQDQIADRLGLHFDVKTKEGRADLLWQRLKTEKKLLVILDDVWKAVNLKEIGIPVGDAHMGCKVLLTTRLRDICSYMECQPLVFLSTLSENEAWALFKINAGLSDEDSNLNTVAKKVARECQGLPIALVTVGRALRDKSTVEWEVASKQLKNSQFKHMELIGEQKNIYSCLKFSYDYLKHEETKLCFLLCCLFPEDYNIPIEELTRYAVGYGLHQDVESIEDARKEVYVAIKTLKDCCMLLGTEYEGYVKMHDLVRDVAIQIASSKEHGFMVKAGIGLKEWPMSNKSFEGCTTISLMGNELAELPEGLVCPQLKVLLLELDYDLNVPERFFEGMKEIEVLSLKGGCLSLQSLEFSTNLQSLLLIDCECNDLIWLRKLPRLEILCFIGCSSLEELPDEIGELKELRLLDVTDCARLRRIPVNLIGRLKKLEELLIRDNNSFEGWGVDGCDSTGGTNASLTELNLLSHLAVLSLRIPRVECIPRDFVFPRLLKYDIVLGGRYSRRESPTSARFYLYDISAASLNAKTFEQLFPTVTQIGFIDVEGLENIALSSDQMTSHGHGSQKDFFQSLEDVKVYGCRDTRTLFLAKWRQALNNLTSVVIKDCESLEEVFEFGEAGEGINEEKELLSSLTRLELKWLPELKCIWKGPTRHVSLQSLVHLELWSLNKLTFIFTPHLAQSLVHLETLKIDDCSGLKHLIGEKDDEREIIPESLGFPKLKTLSISHCDKLEYVFLVSVSPSLLNLEEMEIAHCANLMQIFYSGEGHAHTSDGVINFPRLRELSLLSGCSFFGPKNFTAHVPSLQVLYIREHEELGDLLAQLQGHTNLRKKTIKDIEFLPSKEFTPSESSKEAFEQIMKALKDDNVNMIGLYGMGGVGKTTLVKEVGRRAKETQLFDEVLLAIVSQNPNVMDIQDRMAESLGLHFDERTTKGRANRLWKRLETEKKLLVILDDVWKVVNLKEIGIPVGDDHRGCKVLLTTRDRGICFHMQCQQNVLLSILSENEAWALFKINAGLRDEDSNLNTVAKEVARECQGLPIALVTVGRALRGKSVDGWEVASTKLKNSQLQHMERNGEQKNAYGCLKLSYDYLKHERTKLCFLLCCLFPEDYNIPIEDLTRYTVGYGLHQDVESIEDARKQVYVAIKTLKDCCMLLGTESEKYVKMHDLVRDVAIQIASSKEHGFMVKAGIGLKEWPRSNKSFEGCTTISLMGNQLTELPEGLVFPQLKVLLLELDSDLNVPARLFEGMKEIEVLSLKGGCLSLQSLEFSTNLQSLLLIDCECNDLIWLRKLPRLEILCFIGCSSLEELPDEIGELKELRLLDVTGCKSLRRIPVNLIGRLKKLEELLIRDNNSFEGWGVDGCDSTGRMNASLTELNLLSHLAVLSLRIPRVECIPRDFVFPRLLKYDIVLGDGYSRAEHPTSTRLYLSDISAASLNAKTFEQLFPTVSQIAFKNVEGLESIALSCDQMTSNGHGSQKDFLQRLEDVEVYGCRDIRTLFPAKWRQALNNLTSVEIGNCESLEEVFELGEAEEGINEEKELSSLTRLELTFLPELKCIWKGPTRHVSLRSLIHLKLEFLDKLTFIFTPHLAQSLVHLETLRINYCSGLKHLISEKDDEREIIPESLGFPKLKNLSISRCDELEYVFPVTVSPSLLNLEEMEIAHCANLKQIFYSGEGHAHTRDGVINFPRLRELSLLSGCSFFGPKNFTAHVPSLQVLYIREHEELGDLLAQLQGHTNLRKKTIKDIEFLPSKVFTPSESSKEAFEQIMKALKDDNVNMIGLYGMGGVGKTTLVKEVGRRAKETQLFDEVLLAIVSQNPNVMYMQDQMAESLGLRFDEKTKEGRANRLWQGLKKKKKLLVILDDVWQDVDLEEIGIPFGDDHRGCKVLLTTRGRDICSSMECQQKVYLNILSENEAWALFKINAGLRDEDCNLNTVAKKVARECQGLLIALVTVGRALRDKSTVEWEVASKELKNSQFKLIDEKNIMYSCLKLSYDYLKHEKTKLCFLLCCLFPEDYNIPIEDLTRYTVGYGLHQDVESIEDARKQVYVAIKTLKDCCMLLGTESEKYVKMHDLVRDVAIQIASKEHGFMVKAGIGLKEWPRSNKSFEGCTTISLKGNKLAQLPEGLVCPQLKVLLLELDRDLKVPERFFEGMKEIEVLSLEGGCLSLQSLEFSTNLQLLLLIHCKCKDDESEIIPDSLGFPKLKTLSIRCCDELEFVFPVSVSPSLLNLEEMEIVFCDNLKQIFYIGEGDAPTRDDIINFPQLRKLTLSSCCFFGPKNFTAQLPSLQVLYIEEHEELGDLLAQFQGHTNLREIHITDCEGAQEIIQVGSFVTNKRTGQEFSLLSLKKLDLSFLPEMRCIWKGLVLSHLTILEVCYCQKLTHVFTSSMVASLVQLQFLAISACEELEQIIAKDNDDEKDQILSESDLQSLCFPNLCKVEIKGCNKLRSLFPVAMASGLPKLETLDVSHSSQLMGVFWQDDHASPVNVEKQMVFPNLSFLRLHNLPSIVCFSLGCDDFLFPCLEDSMVDECPKLTTKFPRKTNGSMSAPSEVLLIRLDFMPLF